MAMDQLFLVNENEQVISLPSVDFTSLERELSAVNKTPHSGYWFMNT